MLLVPNSVDPVVDPDATVFANGSLSNHADAPPLVSTNDAPALEVVSGNQPVVKLPAGSYSPTRTVNADNSSHA
jgi:hypothetical protein